MMFMLDLTVLFNFKRKYLMMMVNDGYKVINPKRKTYSTILSAMSAKHSIKSSGTHVCEVPSLSFSAKQTKN